MKKMEDGHALARRAGKLPQRSVLAERRETCQSSPVASPFARTMADRKRLSRINPGILLCVSLTLGWPNAARCAVAAATITNQFDGAMPRMTAGSRIVLPSSVPDPMEPFNRGIWAFNKGVMLHVVQPSGKVYRCIVRKPIRQGIANFGRNVMFPGRFVNTVLQGNWPGMRAETDRFFCNTILGGAGFVDVATRLKIPKVDADFGQTFGKWGWYPGFYIMLPIYGPSNERDTVGLVTDTLANPMTYISPYSFTAADPRTYISPYTYYSFGTMYNNLTDSVDEYVHMGEAEMDPYSKIQYAWTFVRDTQKPDFRLTEAQDQASLETLGSIRVKPKDPRFANHSTTRSVTIPSTHKELEYTYWLQPKKAPVVYIIPGLGSHRFSDTVLALAELVYNDGFSAVCVSSAYNYEFMEHASTTAMPAYTPSDAHDLHVALTGVDRQLRALYPHRLGARALMGYSMGAFHSLFISTANPDQNQGLIPFDRFVALDTPVRLLYGISKLDEFYQAPAQWPADERTARLRNTFLKVAAVARDSESLQTNAPPPFSGVESKFIIGLAFRFILRDAIYTSQKINNMHVLQRPLAKYRRAPVYEEILQYSYGEYFEKFVIPYYKNRGIDLSSPEAQAKASDLRAYQTTLQANKNVRVIVNRNDILLAPTDLAWLQSTFSPDRLTVFDQGGHLGNLGHPIVQKTILANLEDLKAPPP